VAGLSLMTAGLHAGQEACRLLLADQAARSQCLCHQLLLLQIEIWSMFRAMQAHGLKAGGVGPNAKAEGAAARVCQPLRKRTDRSPDWPVGRPDDRDDLGYLLPQIEPRV
jgi:hypothetical protein